METGFNDVDQTEMKITFNGEHFPLTELSGGVTTTSTRPLCYYSIKVSQNLKVILSYSAKQERHSVSMQQKTYTV
jgi:hypothetical protein